MVDLLQGGVPPRNIVHAAVDGWRASDLRTLVMSASTTFLAGTTGRRYWFLDEITSVLGDWPNTIKNLRDNDAPARLHLAQPELRSCGTVRAAGSEVGDGAA